MKRKIVQFFKNFWEVINRPEMAILPGQLAFFFVLSVVPILTIIAYGASVLNVSYEFISEFIARAFSSDIASLLMPGSISGTVSLQFIISLGVAFFIASNGAASIIVTSNSIYGIKNGNYFKRRLKALVMTFIMVLLLIFVLIVPLFGNMIIELVQYVDLNANVTDNVIFIFKVLQGPVSWFIIFLFIKMIFTMAPDKKLKSNMVNYGAMFSTLFWIISTGIYSWYINNFARYDVFYGGLSNIVILMLWVYLLAYIFVIGMALNQREEVELEKTGQINLLNKENNKK